MDGGVAVGLLVVKFLDAEDVGKGLKPLHPRVLEGIGGLLAERRAVNQEQDAPEALRLQQPVDERNAGLCLARAGGHRQQDGALPGLNAGLCGTDGLLLVRAQGEAVIEGCVLQGLVRSRFIALQKRGQAIRRIPAVERVAVVFRPAQIAEPDPALVCQLAQKRAPVGRKHERDSEGCAVAVVAGGKLDFGYRPETAAVALGLLQRSRHIDVLAFGLDHRHRAHADEESVVGRPGFGGPFSDGHRFVLLRARTLVEGEDGGICGPACGKQLLVNQLAGVRFTELNGGRRRVGGSHQLVDGLRWLGRRLGL